jgi:hypothetical protein
MLLRSSALLAALLALPAVASAAPPRLVGTYTMSGPELCQYLIGSNTGRGQVDLRMLEAVFAAGTVKISGASVGGSLFATAPDVGTRTKSGTIPYRITGTANPYTMTLGTAPDTRSYRLHLSQVDGSGIAHHAQTLETDTNSAGKTVCTRALTLHRH